MRALINDQHRRIDNLTAWVQCYREQCEMKLNSQHFQVLIQHIRTASGRTNQHMTGIFQRRVDSLRELNGKNFPDRLVCNLSTKILTQPQLALLQRDVGYNLMDAKALDFVAALESAIFRIGAGEETKNSLKQQVTGLLMGHRGYQTLSKQEREALEQLKRDNSIVILPADKGRATVVMDKAMYTNKALDLLNDRTAYRVVDKDPMVALRNHTNKLLDGIKRSKKVSEDVLRKVRPSDSALARFYGLPKIHKANVPLRPIVAFRGTPTSELAKWLSNRISHLANSSTNTVRSAEEFLDRIRTLRVEEDEVMVSFDIISLFTSIPQDLAITTLRDLLNQGSSEHQQDSLQTEDLIKLAKVCLKTYFTFQGTIYEQTKGTPMGSPISSVIAEVVLQRLEHIVMAQYQPKFWARYVDDTFTVIKRHQKIKFMGMLNSVYPDIQFTMEEERQGSLAFLDVLVHRQPDGTLDTRVYRKPTCTDRILHHESNHPTAHKASCIRALFKRVDSHCSTARAKIEERNHLFRICKRNGYPTRFIRRYSAPLEPRRDPGTNEPTPRATLVTLPYICNVSEATARLLAPYNVKVAHRPNQTLRAAIMRPKDPLPTMDKSAVVYRIDCGDCPSNYVGETAKRVRTRVHEHKLAVKRGEQYSQIATHMTETGHRFDFEKVQVLASDSTKGGRLLKEAWLSNKDSINRHIDLCPAHLTLRAWSMSNPPPQRRQHKGTLNIPTERIIEKTPSLPPPSAGRWSDKIQTMSGTFPPTLERLNTSECLRGALGVVEVPACALGTDTHTPRHLEGRELPSEGPRFGTPLVRALNSSPYLREKRAASLTPLSATTPDYHGGYVQDDPARVKVERIEIGDGERRRLGATTTRSYSKRGEIAPLTSVADTTHPPHLVAPSCPDQQAARKNPQDGNIQARNKKELGCVTVFKSSNIYDDRVCGKGKCKENKRQRTVTRQPEGSGGGGDRVTQTNEVGVATRQKKRGNIPSNPEPNKEETSDAINKKCRKAIIASKEPVIGKQPDSSGPMTRSRSRVQTLANL